MKSIQEVCRQLTDIWSKADTVGFDELDVLEEFVGRSLPADYKYFLQFFSNGGECDLPGGYVRLYPAEELLVRNGDYAEIGINCGRFLIGIEGDDGFFLDLNLNSESADFPVVVIPLSAIDEHEKTADGSGFAEFLSRRL